MRTCFPPLFDELQNSTGLKLANYVHIPFIVSSDVEVRELVRM